MTFLTAFLGIEIESCLLCKITPSHPHLCPADDNNPKKPKAWLHFFSKYLELKRCLIAFIAFAVLEEMLVQMYN